MRMSVSGVSSLEGKHSSKGSGYLSHYIPTHVRYAIGVSSHAYQGSDKIDEARVSALTLPSNVTYIS